MHHDPTVASMLLGLAHDFERYAEKYGEPNQPDDLLSNQVRYLERVLQDDVNDRTPRPVAQARGRDEKH